MVFNEFFIGKRERMSWVAEATYGTTGTMTGGEIVGYDCIITPSFDLGWQEILSAGASDRQVQSRVIGPKSLNYSMSFTPINWRWLKYLMSCADSTDGATKTHTFTVGSADASYTLEWARRHTTSSVITLLGNVIQSATISFTKTTGPGTEGFIKVSTKCFAQNLSEGSSVTSLSNLTATPFQYRMAKVTIDGTEYKEVNNGELTIESGIEMNDSRYCNSTYGALIGEPIPKIFRVSGRFNINLKNNSLYTLWAAGAYVTGACTLLFDRDGTGNDQMLFTMSSVNIVGAVGPTNLEGVSSVDVVWNALGFTSAVARDSTTTY